MLPVVPGGSTIPTATDHGESTPRVAVVIPAYDAESTLAECLSSVLAQTERDIEVVVIDDGSRDGTADLAQRFAAGDGRVRVLRQENTGPGPARNRGATASTAPLLCFFDADDVMPPTKLATQADHLDGHPACGAVYSSVDEFTVQGRARVPLGRREEPQAPLHESLLVGGMPCLPSAMMVRRSVFAATGGFRGGWSVTEDWDFCVRAAIGGARFAHVSEPAVLYRRHGAQRSTDARGYFEDCQRIMEFIHDSLRAAGRTPPRRVRLRAHWIVLMRAAMADADGRGFEARRLVLSSLRYSARPGNALECLRLLVRPRLALSWAGLESTSRLARRHASTMLSPAPQT